jgi:hypothetical protein
MVALLFHHSILSRFESITSASANVPNCDPHARYIAFRASRPATSNGVPQVIGQRALRAAMGLIRSTGEAPENGSAHP